jgi:hypothetical protein
LSGSPPSRDAEGEPPGAEAGPRAAGSGGDTPGIDAEQLIAELKKAKVSDLLVQTCSVIASLGFAKLSEEARDLEQCRLAIEALKALHPLLPEEHARDIREVVANLQLAFASAAR